LVKGSIVKRAEKGICGWELSNPDHELFNTRILEVFGSCKDCEFAGECLTPCESMRCLEPKNGELYHLGDEPVRDGIKLTYYALVEEQTVRYIQLSEPEHYWARAQCIEEEQVPNWVLSRMNRDREQRL
jgi:hypothetical protein